MAKKQYSAVDMNNNKLTGLPTPTTTETTAAANVAFVLENAGGAPQASNVSFTPDANTFPADTDNVDGALKHLFTSANDGKEAIAGVIGSPASASDSFSTLAGYVTTAKTALDTFIDKAEGTTDGTETLAQLTSKLDDVRVFKQITKLRKQANSTEIIQLQKPINKDDMVVTALRLNGDDVVNPSVFTADFNNGDQDDFFENSNLSFENDRAEIPVVILSQAYSQGTIREVTIDVTPFDDFRISSIDDVLLSYQTIRPAQVLIANDDIPIGNVGDITKINLTIGDDRFITPQLPLVFSYTVKYAMSFDSGATWYGIKNSEFVEIEDINDKDEFYTKGIFGKNDLNYFYSENEISQDKKEQIVAIRNNSSTLRFAYYIRRYQLEKNVFVDQLLLGGRLKGTLEPANDLVNISFDQAQNKITLTFAFEDTYRINWIDKP